MKHELEMKDILLFIFVGLLLFCCLMINHKVFNLRNEIITLQLDISIINSNIMTVYNTTNTISEDLNIINQNLIVMQDNIFLEFDHINNTIQ